MSTVICSYPTCNEPAIGRCDNCDEVAFCSDHGSPGGDQELSTGGVIAVPARCFACGGFNADE